MSRPTDLLDRALDQAGAVIGRIRPDQAVLPTPCRSWDVRALVGHVVGEVAGFAGVAAPEVADDRDGAYRVAADALRERWRRPGALAGTVSLAMGEVPAAWVIDQQVTELAVHAWDLATATGQPTDLDPRVGRRALEFLRANLRPEHRGDEASGRRMGLEAPVAADAPLYDRLAAVAGRTPRS
jgi:uncharacterized protein (TIGR03086 family)